MCSGLVTYVDLSLELKFGFIFAGDFVLDLIRNSR